MDKVSAVTLAEDFNKTEIDWIANEEKRKVSMAGQSLPDKTRKMSSADLVASLAEGRIIA